MDHWQAPYLGIRSIPPELNEFELNTFFTFSAKERLVIDARRQSVYRLAMALHIGFIRMSGRTLDAYKQIPRLLWAHLGTQLGVEAPEIATLKSIYDERPRTLFDHQQLAYETLGFEQMRENQRRWGLNHKPPKFSSLQLQSIEQRIQVNRFAAILEGVVPAQ